MIAEHTEDNRRQPHTQCTGDSITASRTTEQTIVPEQTWPGHWHTANVHTMVCWNQTLIPAYHSINVGWFSLEIRALSCLEKSSSLACRRGLYAPSEFIVRSASMDGNIGWQKAQGTRHQAQHAQGISAKLYINIIYIQ